MQVGKAASIRARPEPRRVRQHVCMCVGMVRSSGGYGRAREASGVGCCGGAAVVDGGGGGVSSGRRSARGRGARRRAVGERRMAEVSGLLMGGTVLVGGAVRGTAREVREGVEVGGNGRGGRGVGG